MNEYDLLTLVLTLAISGGGALVIGTLIVWLS